MNAKNLRTGKSQNARSRSASHWETALAMSLEHYRHRPQRRRSPEEVHAQLIFIIGTTLAMVFLIVTIGITYALIFVTQPISAQAPNDAAFIDLLKTLAIFLTGSLGGVLAGNGLKSKPNTITDTPPVTRES
jgi:hypothetical protein